MEKTFGIDLGTTHSCLSYVDVSGKPVMVATAAGQDTMPSVIYFERPEQATVGVTAKNAAVLAPHLVAKLFKRDMGEPDHKPRVYHDREYQPEELSALVLRELVRAAREGAGLDVREAVITVPADFGVAARAATLRAGEIAGLTVLDVLAEPVAAALYYQELEALAGARTLLVCDLGGGTFDTSVLTVSGDEVTTVCTEGDTALGGADWDTAIADHLVAEFTARHPRLDPTADALFQDELIGLAEETKIALSGRDSRSVTLRFRGASATVELTRAGLAKLTEPLLERMMAVVERAVTEAAAKGVTSFDEVLLVGGMSRTPAVRERLAKRFDTAPRMIEPDLAVAKGAALYAVTKRFDSATAGERLGISAERAAGLAAKKVRTVVPRSFGVKAIDARDPLALTDPLRARQMIVHLLHANTALPADSGPFPFSTSIRNQRMVEVEVWEQVGPELSEAVEDNARVGSGLLTRLPARPAGATFDVTFAMSETGTLTVTAVEPDSGARVQFELRLGGWDQSAVDKARAGIARHEVSG
ncbi:Hsp70 family protein [Actinokineospora iranica]|uniref:Molecular chaperone DnaK (HSP70) n=1 Tax=Actinokineospora iranica TaxID=1271860 RepID=A0A1G6QD29_9PSEU|nr:Hsp70 family protein [Actinokineospora iranica]SDC89577.1 Molecular chaperone DnaK (HSP70) [Actinokineospora iranica]